MTQSKGPGGTIRWMAPELFSHEDDDGGHPTTASDVYALSLVFWEVTGKSQYLLHS
jgi:serine/threonine protein kinase